MDQITYTKCNKSSWMRVNKILLSRDRPEQFPSFLEGSFQWYQTTMRWSRVSKACHFLRTFANFVDSMLFHCFYDSYNFVAKYFQNALLELVQTLPRLRQLWQVHSPLSDFFKKLLVQRNTKINEKRNGVITLLWRLRLQENPDHKKVSSLYNTAVVTFFPYLYSRRPSWRSNLGDIPPKNLVEPP